MNTTQPKQLYPAILTDSLETLEDQVNQIKNLDELSTIHIDIIDGFFIDHLTVTADDLVETDFEPLQLDFHLMVNEPGDFVLEMGALPVTLPVRAVIGQIERMTSQAEFLQEVKKLNWKRGLALDLYTPLDEIEEESWKNIEVLQLMGIEAGEQGRSFVPLALEKIKAAADLIQAKGLEIELLVDGGVKVSNAAKILEHGATGLVVGSDLWQAEDIGDEVAQFEDLLK